VIAILLLAFAAQEPASGEVEELPAFDFSLESTAERRAVAVQAASKGLGAVRAVALEEDRALLDGCGALLERLRAALEMGKPAPRALEPRGDVESVDEEGVTIRPRRGEAVKLRWDEIPLAAAGIAMSRDLRARDRADLEAAGAALLLSGDVEGARRLFDSARRAGGSGSILPDPGPLLAAFEQAAREASALERLRSWGSSVDPEEVRAAMPSLAGSSLLARNRAALRARVRAALAQRLAGRDRLPELFAGDTKVLGEGLVEIRYDFSDSVQVRDFVLQSYPFMDDLWLQTQKPGIDSRAFELEEGRLAGVYRASLFHRAFFEPDCVAEAEIRLEEAPGFAAKNSPVAVAVGFTYDQGRNFVASMSLKGIWQLTNEIDEHGGLERIVLPRPGDRGRVRFERLSGRVRALLDGRLEAEADDKGPPRGQAFVWLQGAAHLIVDDVVVRGRLAPGWLRNASAARAVDEAARIVPE
jgi:hypothetical protein